MFKTFLIKYGEIAIKGKNRHLFEDALVRQICHALKKCDGEFSVYKEQGRIYVDCEGMYDYERRSDICSMCSVSSASARLCRWRITALRSSVTV